MQQRKIFMILIVSFKTKSDVVFDAVKHHAVSSFKEDFIGDIELQVREYGHSHPCDILWIRN